MIAVTGIGIVSPYGVGVDAFKEGSIQRQGLNPVDHFDLNRYGLDRAGCVPTMNAKKYISPMKARRMSRFSQMATIASKEAWDAAGLNVSNKNNAISGVIVGTGLGSVESTDSFFEGLVKRGPLETNPILFPETVQNIAAAHISIELGINGPNTTFSQGDISGESAIYYAYRLLSRKIADTVLVCGADELTEPLVTGMSSMKIFSNTETLAPFDRSRNGIIPGEGAAALVLERTVDATNRGAEIIGHIRGFGFGSDSVERLSYAGPGSMINTIEETIRASGIEPELISASANSSRGLDLNEALSIKSVLGEKIPVTAVKSLIGSFMSSGVLRLVASLLSMREGFIPPIFGLDNPEITGLNYIVNKPLKKNISSCLVNGFSHGGANLCIMVTA
jgi:3-oxoacyl-[acyl-carrier-protein] synthase II